MTSTEAIIVISFSIFILLVFRIGQLKFKLSALEPVVKTIENEKDIHYQYCLKDGGYYVYLSKSVDNILGEGSYEQQMNNPQLIYSMIHPNDLKEFMKKEQGIANFDKPLKYRVCHQDGHYVWLEEYVTPIIEEGKVVLLNGIYRDISEEMNLKEQLQYKITHDSLTNVYNRTFFDELFDTYNEQKDEFIGIMICDLDNLKMINDQCGHNEGDQVIKDVAKILKQFEDEQIFLARIGGDEFAFFKIGCKEHCFENIKIQINDQLEQLNGPVPLHISIGYADTAHSVGNLIEVFKKADQYMYEDKRMKSTAYTR